MNPLSTVLQAGWTHVLGKAVKAVATATFAATLLATAAPVLTPIASAQGAAIQWSQRLADISQAYRDILGRQPDNGGLSAYANSGMSIDQIRASLLGSNEYKQRHQAPVASQSQYQPEAQSGGPAVQWSQRLADISQAYRDILGREPDNGGLTTYANSGMSIPQIRASLASSTEYQQRHPGQGPMSVAPSIPPPMRFTPAVSGGPAAVSVGAQQGGSCNVSVGVQAACSVGLQCGVGLTAGFCGSVGSFWGPAKSGCSLVTCCAQIASVSCGIGVGVTGSVSVGPQANFTYGTQSLGSGNFNYNKPRTVLSPYQITQQRAAAMSRRR